MIQKLRGFAKDSVLYGLGDFLGKLASLILVPILSRIFLPAEYGIIDLLNITYAFVLMIVSLNLYTGLQKYYYLSMGEERKILLSSTVFFLFLISTFFTTIMVIFSKSISLLAFQKTDYYMEIILSAIRLPFDIVFAGLMLLLRLNRKAVIFSFYNIMKIIILPVTTYICVVSFHMGLEGVFLAPLVTCVILVFSSFIHQRSAFTRNIDFSKAAKLTKFSLPGHPAIIILNTMEFLPRYLLAYYSTLTAVGLFGMANRIARILEMTKTAFNRAWNPFAFANAGKDDEKYLYEKIFKLFAAALILLSLTLSLFAKEALMMLTPPQYHSAAPMVCGLCFYFGVRALLLIFSTGLYSVNKVAHTSILGMIQLFSFFLCAVILIPYYKAAGLVLALDIAALIYFICYAITIKRYFRFNFSSYRILSLLSVAVTSYIVPTIYMTNDAFNANLFLSKLNFLFLNGIISFFVILTKDERTLILKKLRYFYPRRFLIYK